MNKICVSYETAAQMLDFTDGQVIAKLVKQNRLQVCYPSGARTPRILVTDLEAYVRHCKSEPEELPTQDPDSTPCPSEKSVLPTGGFLIKTPQEAVDALDDLLAPRTTATLNS